MLNVLKKDIIIMTAKDRSQNVYHAEDHMNRLIKIVKYFILPAIYKTLQVLQLNI